jgi:hypothetical protein
LAGLGWLGAGVGAQSALAATLCVGTGAGCYPAVQAAVDSAHDGDTIQIGPGTFPGGITITKSVHVVGISSASTIISGGGPVLTIGDGSSRPTVSIERVTITGGLNTSDPGPGFAAGGGIEIPPLASDNTTGATVTIADSVIAGNQAEPLTLVSNQTLCALSTPTPPPLPPCAVALGGGIDNSGTLTVINTQVTGNVAGSTVTQDSVTTVARGGGIYNHPQGVLTLGGSSVSDNAALVTAADSYAARGGGILVDGVMTMSNSQVTNNRAELYSLLPGSIFVGVGDPGSPAHAVGGGIAITDAEGSATVANSTISGNAVSASNTASDALADAGGIDVEGSLMLNNSRVDGNHLQASVAPNSGANAAALGGGIETGGDTATVTVNNSNIHNNAVQAQSANGGAFAFGGGLADDDTVTLHHTDVSGNSGTATGAFGLAQGGGIANADYDNRTPHLTVIGSRLTNNTLTGSPGFSVLGGGLFSAHPLALTPIPARINNTQFTGNQPDQCFGC